MDWISFFQDNPMFELVTVQELRKLLKPQVSREITCSNGEEIVSEGMPGRALYFVGEGSVSLSVRDPEGKEISLGTIEEGEFFGELTLLGEQPRSASVRAKRKCVLLRVDAAEFHKIMGKHPAVISEMLLTLSERLRHLAERIVDIAYNQVDRKLELFSTKLDAELKAVNTSLTASQTIFAQTTARAHEAISSTERSWSNIVKAGSALAIVLSVLGGTAAYFGIERFNDLDERAEKAVASLEKNMATAKEDADAVKSAKHAILDSSLLTMTPILLENLGTRRKVDIYARTAKELIKYMVQSGSLELTTPIFIQIYSEITKFRKILLSTAENKNKKYRYDAKILGDIRELLQPAIEYRDHKNVHTRDVTMSFYLILTCLALEQNKKLYVKTHDKMKYYLQTEKRPYITAEDKTNFEPTGIIVFIDAIQKENLIEASAAREIKQNMHSLWSLISAD